MFNNNTVFVVGAGAGKSSLLEGPNGKYSTVTFPLGTEIKDEITNGVVTKHCSEAVDANGKPRFPDGVSVELNFRTAPADLVRPAP